MKRRLKRLKTKHLLYFILFLAFFAKGLIFLDPDFGWRLRAGERYLNQGIPKTDIFTYTMPSFPWVDHAWSLSAFIFFIYPRIGLIGLAFLFAGIPFLTLFILASSIREYISDKRFFKDIGFSVNGRFLTPKFLPLNFETLGFFASFPILLTISLLFTFFGIRVQVLSWLMLIILLVLLKKEVWIKWRNITPIFFLIWANLHGSFLSGLTALFIYLSARSFRERKIKLSHLFLFSVSSLATLVNPFGVGIWREVLSSFLDTSLRFKIVEWMPAVIMLDLPMAIFISISFGLILKFRRKFLLEELFLYTSFLLQAVSSRRHLPLWALIAAPLTVRSVYYLWQEAKKFKFGVERFKVLYKWAWVSCLLAFLLQSALSFNETFALSEKRFYPKNAVSYLKQNPPEGNIFSEYGWGGYLIWKLPEKKVFIDGRMPSWRWNQNPTHELDSAFDVYNNITEGEISYVEIFDRFSIDTVALGKPKQENDLDRLFDKLEEYLTIFGWKKKQFDFLGELRKDGWAKIYEDDVAEIHQKKN